ncbi:TOMM precursor leader peptide-binding protein [Pseudalkalibacillus sp. R45]|uniref:TOMM precursor leader peptide-binding protein n=1 Tax=Pseudalkalibacillus sp. R45 TaxID=3457433 RepID=UPI003FCEA395
MSASILIVGFGRLADKVYEKLAGSYKINRRHMVDENLPEMTELVLVLHDAWVPADHLQAEEVYRRLRVPWLRGFFTFGEGMIGPFIHPDQNGCSYCADTRLLMAGRDKKEMWGLKEQRIAQQEERQPDAWLSDTAILQMVQLIDSEVRRFFEGMSPQSADHLYLLNLKSMDGAWRFILPESACPVCSRLLDDTESDALITLQSSPKVSSDSYRCRPMDELKAVLEKDYFSSRSGMMNGKMYDTVTPFADVIVTLPLFSGNEGTAGRTHSYELSEQTAMLEALERSCGTGPRAKRTVVRDTYENLADKAIHPLRFGVHEDEHYAEHGFPYKKFDPARELNWVWGHSFLQERPVLVPELLAYYSVGCGEGLVYETSNGCALGGSLEEAIFYGIMEVIERDAFLMTWYGRLRLPRIDPFSAGDKELIHMIERMRDISGYDFHLYNATMEHGVPAVWAFVKNSKDKGMNLLCAAGAHLDPVKATKSAIYELAGMVVSLETSFEAGKSEYKKLLEDPSEVRIMDDHGRLYGLKEAEERLGFLMDEDRPTQTFSEAFPPPSRNLDLTEDLKGILDTFKRLDMEVIVVDQTSSEIRRNGLHCVKVLIPGMLPMTFGHNLIRINGLDRVLNIPMELGYRERPLTREELNPYPHPFP